MSEVRGRRGQDLQGGVVIKTFWGFPYRECTRCLVGVGHRRLNTKEKHRDQGYTPVDDGCPGDPSGTTVTRITTGSTFTVAGTFFTEKGPRGFR